MKIVKSRLFKNYLERKKSQAQFCLSLGWLHISEKKLLETATLVGAGARNIGKEVSFLPNFDPNFTDTVFGESKDAKFYILKKFGLSAF